MNRLHKRRLRRNANLCPLPLFAWAASQPTRNHSRAVERLASHFGLSASLALTIAELAGLSTEGDHV
jgi:hypothetical protein